ncbi:hypothetical protein [Labrenzia sp. PHM005]|uniref:hypothetical protein n=1 Tax=Labrenzia sp. PHM005 TaxID=2590016 RepID=UPI001140727F|nr:hypothetical protein [Labrenzia sp. PHM005]QDG75124.1 hypothetical protein FJ695_04185 [Labrenzia sp. PHM005]
MADTRLAQLFESKQKTLTVRQAITEKDAWTMLLHDRLDILIENPDTGKLQMKAHLGESISEISRSSPFYQVPLHMLFSKAHSDGKQMFDIWGCIFSPIKCIISEH